MLCYKKFPRCSGKPNTCMNRILFFFLIRWFLFIFNLLFLAVLGLHCYTQAFSSCGKWGLLSSWGAQASHLWYFLLLQSMGFRVFGLQELWYVGLVVLYVACGIFLEQRLKPCALQILNHWTTREIQDFY